MIEKLRHFAERTDVHRPGELRRRITQAAPALTLAAVVIGSVLAANGSDNRIHALCKIARVGMGDSCEDRIANLAETATRVRFAGTITVGALQSPIQPKEAERDPTNPCGPADSRAVCTCKRELLDQQNGGRLNLEPQCRAILRSGRADQAAG